jgi:prolyl-tRNA editing enzyme YbaK/EbsC (Cys-tRNA(Pro) deacylase)
MHIKTLIWKATTTTNNNNNNNLQTDEPATVYIATILPMHHRVNQRRLQKLICSNNYNSNGARVQLSLADCTMAETLTGFPSGTIPPFGHVVALTVYVEETMSYLDETIVRTGSGVRGYDLQMAVSDIVFMCRATCARVVVGPVILDSPDSIVVRDHEPAADIRDQRRSQEPLPVKDRSNDNSPLLLLLPPSSYDALPLPLIKQTSKPLVKRLRDAAGKMGRAEQVRQCIQEAGPNLADLMSLGKDGNYTKNALHLAAWKGDLESIVLLAEAGRQVNRDFINDISIGEGNYGKTPIFYAIYQDRDDAVKALMDLGVNLLIINNKGQSPCSLASGHLSNDTCHAMYRLEEEQLQAGMTFTNYRVTHSDGKMYGDLDPRFSLDDINMGDDIADDLEMYASLLSGLPTVRGIPVGTRFPRVLRQTTAESRSILGCSQQTPKKEEQIHVVLQSDQKSAHDRLVHKLRSSGVDFHMVHNATAMNDNTASMVRIKTQVWKVVFHSENTCPDHNDGLYVVTAISVQADVDEDRLRALLSSSKGEVRLELADSTVVTRITGFEPDTLPPFGHTIPLALYLDEGLLFSGVSRTEKFQIPAGTKDRDLQMDVSELIRFCSSLCTIFVHPFTKSQSPLDNTNEGPLQTQIRDWTKEATTSEAHLVKPKTLAKRMRDAAGKKGKIESVLQCIQEAGDSFPDLLFGGEEGTFTKSAIHLAASKGDLETVTLLVETGHKFGRNLLDEVSTGDGNYGKTPIFYSISFARMDHTRQLMSLGASLLVVNNKGQTPCSLAPSRFPEEFCRELFQLEEAQLRSGGSFINYRMSHSDGKKYGDLDPRFFIDNNNMGEDLVEELKIFRTASAFYEKVNGVPVGYGFPRVVRLTTEALRYSLACQRWGKKPMPRRLFPVQRAANVLSAKAKLQQKPNVHKHMDVDCLELMYLSSIMESAVIVVNSMEGIEELSVAIDLTIAEIERAFGATNSSLWRTESASASIAWGIDCEWLPTSKSGHDNPVATLQLSSASQAFVIDIQTLCQKSLHDDSLKLTDIEVLLSYALTNLFTHKSIALVGFAVAQDLCKLAHSFPHLPCFRLFEMVVDYQTVAQTIFRDKLQPSVGSLQKAVAVVLGKKLDKSEQCSDWEQRPLSASQIEYAALDAAVARHLFWKTADELEGTYHALAETLLSLKQTIRMTFVGAAKSSSADGISRVTRNEKVMLGTRFLKQSWVTGDNSPAPLPLVDAEEKEATKTGQIYTKKERRVDKPSKVKTKKKGVPLRNIPGDLDHLPPAGALIGYTKDSCVNRTIGKTVVNSIPQDFGFRYNRWGGIIEMQNCFLLFVNCSGHSKDWKYSNEFFDGGKQVSFSANAEKEKELSFLHDLGALDSSGVVSESAKTILLFARPNSNTKYVYCGPCCCVDWSTQGQIYELRLEMLAFDTLVGDYDQMTPYLEMIMIQTEDPIR